MPFVKRSDVEKLIADASPHDGFGVNDIVVGQGHALYLVFRVGGVIADPPGADPHAKGFGQLVWEHKGDSPMSDKDYGDKARLKLVLDAMCRFMNTCGDPAQLRYAFDTLREFAHNTQRMAVCDFHLIDSVINTEGVAEHVFANEASPYAIRWVEGQFFDVVALSDMQKEVRALEEETDVRFAGAAEGTETGGLQSEDDFRDTRPDGAEPPQDLRQLPPGG